MKENPQGASLRKKKENGWRVPQQHGRGGKEKWKGDLWRKNNFGEDRPKRGKK